jgi:CRP-like cAMP-binding protein
MDQPPKKIVERFPQAPLFDGLSKAEISQFLTHAENVEAGEGDRVIREGEPGDGLYVISTGIFEVVKEATEKEQVIARLEEMSSFGEMSLFDDSLRSASVIARKTGRLKRFSREGFHQLLDSGDIVAYKVTLNICKLLARRLAEVDDRLVS